MMKRCLKKIKLLCLLLILQCCASKWILCYSQVFDKIHPSANIGWSLSDFKQENNLYTGTANINIPLAKFEIGKTILPISLSYNTKAIQVDQLPSWVGLGWNLNAGGQISRVVNGEPDEIKHIKPVRVSWVYYYGGTYFGTTNVETYKDTDHDYAYISNYNRLSNPNWNTDSYIFGTLNPLPFAEDISTLQNIVSDNGVPQSNVILAFDVTHRYDFEPDEFDFNALGMSGKFFLNHEGKWICESNDGNYDVQPLIAENVPKSGLSIRRMIYGFVLTAPDGTKLYFGGNQTNKTTNVEFWRGPKNTFSSDGTLTPVTIASNAFLGICPTAWHLNKIETTDNYIINFSYKKGQPQVIYSDAPYGTGDDVHGFKMSNPGARDASLAEPWYLTGITCSNGINVELLSIDSWQLGSNVPLSTISKYDNFADYADLFASIPTAYNNMQKLTGIKIKQGNVLKKFWKFDYIENITERLKLTSVKEVLEGMPDEVSINKYAFEYNVGKLPAYASGLTDHWGFYNNKKYFTSSTQVLYPISRAILEQQYYASREPDFSYAISEMLEKVYFPTGGFRQFVYEANQYSSIITRWPFGFQNENSNKTTGGVRLKKVIDYSGDGASTNETEFIYKKDIQGTESSGVLGMPKPEYTAAHNQTEYVFESRSFVPFDRLQSHITYSTVYERKTEGSYTKNTFSNFDNGLTDAAPSYEYPTPAFWDKQPFCDNSFKRGLLLKKSLYTNTNDLVKETSYQYQYEIDDYSRYVRALRMKGGDNVTRAGYRAAAYPIYYFPNQIRYTKDETVFPGNNVVVETNFKFDSYNNLIEQTASTSKGEMQKEKYSYPYTFANSNDGNNPYTKLVSRHINNVVVEKIDLLTKNGINYIVSGEVNDFKEFNGNIIAPARKLSLALKEPVLQSSLAATTYNQQGADLSLDPSYKVGKNILYNSLGKIISSWKDNGIVESYIWAYHGQYPVAQVTGSYADAIKYVNTTLLDNAQDYSDAQVRNEINNIRQNLNNVQVISCTYNPLIGKTSQTDINNKTTYFEYEDFNRLYLVKDNDNNIFQKYCYQYAGFPGNCDGTVFYNTEVSSTFQKSDCQENYIGVPFSYIVPAKKYSSALSPIVAQAKALQDIVINGQVQANQNGACRFNPIYAKVYYENPVGGMLYFANDIVVRFYEDEACTIPVYVDNRTIKYKIKTYSCSYGGLLKEQEEQITVKGTEYYIAYGAYTYLEDYNRPDRCFEYTYSVVSEGQIVSLD